VVALEPEEELNATTFQTYLYLVKVGKPVGPRDLMRGANLSSPSVAYRNLQKLMDFGLVVKDNYGDYVIKEKLSLKGYVWFGKNLIPTFAIFGFIFVGFLIAEIAVLIPHLIVSAPVEESFWFLTAMTIACALIFLIEGLRFRKKAR
jgi:pilus assembly protein TadC